MITSTERTLSDGRQEAPPNGRDISLPTKPAGGSEHKSAIMTSVTHRLGKLLTNLKIRSLRPRSTVSRTQSSFTIPNDAPASKKSHVSTGNSTSLTSSPDGRGSWDSALPTFECRSLAPVGDSPLSGNSPIRTSPSGGAWSPLTPHLQHPAQHIHHQHQHPQHQQLQSLVENCTSPFARISCTEPTAVPSEPHNTVTSSTATTAASSPSPSPCLGDHGHGRQLNSGPSLLSCLSGDSTQCASYDQQCDVRRRQQQQQRQQQQPSWPHVFASMRNFNQGADVTPSSSSQASPSRHPHTPHTPRAPWQPSALGSPACTAAASPSYLYGSSASGGLTPHASGMSIRPSGNLPQQSSQDLEAGSPIPPSNRSAPNSTKGGAFRMLGSGLSLRQGGWNAAPSLQARIDAPWPSPARQLAYHAPEVIAAARGAAAHDATAATAGGGCGGGSASGDVPTVPCLSSSTSAGGNGNIRCGSAATSSVHSGGWHTLRRISSILHAAHSRTKGSSDRLSPDSPTVRASAAVRPLPVSLAAKPGRPVFGSCTEQVSNPDPPSNAALSTVGPLTAAATQLPPQTASVPTSPRDIPARVPGTPVPAPKGANEDTLGGAPAVNTGSKYFAARSMPADVESEGATAASVSNPPTPALESPAPTMSASPSAPDEMMPYIHNTAHAATAAESAAGAAAPPPPAPAVPLATPAAPPSTQLLALNPNVPAAMRRGDWSLDDYTIVRRLFKGATSAVYKATCNRSGLPVALKVYFLKRVPPAVLHMICREIQIHSSLSHPNIIMLYSAFQSDKHLTLVMEYASRGDLFGIHQAVRTRRMDERLVADVVLTPLVDAIRYLHSHGICHRDIKPENVLFTADWRLKLADFGVSINLVKERAVTRAGTVCYMAPEVARCPLKVRPEDNKHCRELAYGTACDIWALGVLTYELLVGFTPLRPVVQPSDSYGAQLAAAAAAAIESEDSRRVLIFPAGISEDSRDFVTWAMAERPEERPSALQLSRHPWIAGARPQPQP